MMVPIQPGQMYPKHNHKQGILESLLVFERRESRACTHKEKMAKKRAR